MKLYLKVCLLVFLFVFMKGVFAQDSISVPLVFKIDIKKEIGSTTWLYTKHGMEEAQKMRAKAILIHMNTYGGQVVFADSIRTKILNSDIPVYVFIDNNAASAGALISIACDSIFMRPGSSIGAATVVGQAGEQMPDKYQSYMRATIRATAEAHGKDTIVNGVDTVIRWFRDPAIAEAMVDASLYVKGVSDTGKVLTFTANEAIAHHYCEGLANNVEEVITKHLGFKNYTLKSFEPTSYLNAKGFLMNPIFQGILIMLIIGGLYFELQSPGIGFPLGVAILAGIMYLAPLYMDGIAQNWEIILFILGVVLVMLEVFVIPGFGIAGISGIVLVVVGLSLSMVGDFTMKEGSLDFSGLITALTTVIISVFLGLFGSIWITARYWGTGSLNKLALHANQMSSDGYVGVSMEAHKLVGKTGVVHSVLRPSGKVRIDDDIYDAVAEWGMIAKGETVVVSKYETGQLYVTKL